MSPWLSHTLIGALFLIPAVLAIGLSRRVFGVPADVFMIWYYLGISMTIILVSLGRGDTLGRFINYPLLTILIMIFVGLTVGAGANIFTFSAYANAPNPGTVQALQELAVPALFFATIALGYIFPAYFKSSEKIHTGWATLAIALMMTGTYLMIFKAKSQEVVSEPITTKDAAER